MSLARDPDKILESLESWGARLELGRVDRLLAHLGHPEGAYATVLVAGTNGKGSTASLLSSMIAAAGYRTGLFTSPHLEGVEERLRIGGRAIARNQLAGLLDEILEEARSTDLEPPTYFEALSLASCLWFARSKIDLAVVEVGMGGRLDATNACEPQLSVVAEIGIDHAKQLGDTLTAIAREKAGIFRSGVVAICGATVEEACAALRARAAEIGAPLVDVRDRVRSVSAQLREDGQRVRLRTSIETYELDLPLLGEHQVRNLSLAVTAAEELAEDGWSQLDRFAIERGVKACRWPGRLETVVLPGGKTLWLDAAHNPQGASALAAFLDEHLGDHDVLFGVLADKDARPVLEAVTRSASRSVLTKPPSDRALDPALLASWLPEPGVVVEPDLDAALDRALEGDLPLVVCGSLYLVGWVRGALRERFGVPPSAAEPLGAC